MKIRIVVNSSFRNELEFVLKIKHNLQPKSFDVKPSCWSSLSLFTITPVTGRMAAHNLETPEKYVPVLSSCYLEGKEDGRGPTPCSALQPGNAVIATEI